MADKELVRTNGHLQFLRLLLSMGGNNVTSNCHSGRENGDRVVSFNLSLSIDEELYQVCLDLAMQNLLSSNEGEEVSANGPGEIGNKNGKSLKKNRLKGREGQYNHLPPNTEI